MADINEKDVTHWEAGTFLQEPIVVILTFKRSTLVIVYCLIVTLTFCPCSPLTLPYAD